MSKFDAYFGSSEITYETFEKIVLGSSVGIDFSLLQVMDPKVMVRTMDHTTRTLVMEMRAYIWAKQDTQKVPVYQWATWWDHLRADHAPRWMNRRWPPKKVSKPITVHAQALFPELSGHRHPGAVLKIARIDNPFDKENY